MSNFFSNNELEHKGAKVAFPKSITVKNCENFINKLSSNQNVPLELPVDTKYSAFGGLASAIQAINTWARQNGSRNLILRDSVKRDTIGELVVRPHKFAAAMYAKSIVTTTNESSDVRRTVYRNAGQAIEQQNLSPYGLMHGGLCWFAFVDHSTKAYDPHFYIKHESMLAKPRGAEQIEAVIKNMIVQSTTVTGGAVLLSDSDSKNLGRIFYELFLNTHEHGTRGNIRSDWLRPGVRILYTNSLRLEKSASSNIAEDQIPLEQYLSGSTFTKKHRFIEIGIVDSGLGYCDRWSSDNGKNIEEEIMIEEEYEIFRKCFKFRQSSTAANNKGNGLPAVMDSLTKLKGFIRIRSGRLSLYRDFIRQPFSENDECHFNNWVTQCSADASLDALDKASGVAITILVPLEAKL